MSAREVNKGVRARKRRQPAAATAGRCERLSACLLEAMRAGAAPAVERRGERWAIVAGGKLYGTRKERERAESLVEAARRELANAGGASAPPEERRRNVLLTPQRPDGEIVRYEAIPASDLLTSHLATDFRPAPHYPEGVQERAYHLDKRERQKVVRGAQRLRVALVLSRSPTATDGPPIVTERLLSGHGRHLVMGGNGRGMMLVRAYDGDGAEEYRQELIKHAADFGLDPATVRAIRKPILVRVLEGLPADAPRELLVAAVRRTNESLTQGLDAATLGVAHARALSLASVKQIGEALGDGEYSLRELMAARPDVFREALQRDQVLTPQNASEWVTAAGALTDGAKDRLEAMFLGLVLGSKDRIQATAPALLRKLERAVPHLLAVRGAQLQAFDLVPLVQEAVDLLNDARARSLTLEDSLQQSVLFASAGKARSPQVVELARLLDRAGQRAVAEAFARWSKAAIHDPNQLLLLGTPPTPEDAYAALLGGRIRNPSGAPEVPCPRCSASGLIVPWVGNIAVCPTCRGARTVAAPAPGDARQQRLVNPRRARPKYKERDLVQLAPGLLQQGAQFREQPRHGPVRPLTAFVAGEILEVRAVGVVSRGQVPRYLLHSRNDADPRQARSGWIDETAIVRAGGGDAPQPSPPGKTTAAQQLRLFNPRRKRRVVRTDATTTRQLASALRRIFGAVLPRRITAYTPAGRLKLRRKAKAWKVWRDGKESPELSEALTADLGRRSPRRPKP